MNETKGSIFRVDALRRYAQSRVEPVLPRLVCPRTFICAWVLLGLLGVSGFLVWFTQVPVYASGSAVVVDGRDNTQSISDDLLAIAFMPPEHLRRLRVGQTLLLQFGEAGKRVRSPIMAVEPEISSPDAIHRRFALSTGTASAITQPSAVAMARLEPINTDLPSVSYIGSIYRADIEVGSRRVMSLLPLIGRFFGE